METTTLLTYYFPSQPYPLEVSTNNHSMNGSLTVVVSDPGNNIYAESIEIYLPIGAGRPGYLSSNTPLASCNTSRWTIGSASRVKPEELPAVLRVSGRDGSTPNYVQYICYPQTVSDQLIDYDLNFTFQITGVDTFTGPYVIAIGEFASTTANGFGAPVFAAFTSLKAQAAFFLKNFVASAAAGDTNVPIGAIARNTGFRLSWESNGSSFTLYEAQNSNSIYQGTDTQYELADGITTDTTFILQATLDASQAGDGSGFESSVLYDTLTVTCTNADLVTNSIQNATTINSTGDISTQGNISADKNATFQSLTVNDLGTVSSLEVNTSLVVNGSASFASAAATSLSADALDAGTLNADNLNVSGPLVAQTSTVELFSAPQLLLQTVNFSGTHNFVAETDGIVLGFIKVQTVSGDTTGSWGLSAYILVYPPDPQIDSYQVGANLGSNIRVANLSVPVRKGDAFGLQFWGTVHSSNSNPQAMFYFFGMGSGGASDQGVS